MKTGWFEKGRSKFEDRLASRLKKQDYLLAKSSYQVRDNLDVSLVYNWRDIKTKKQAQLLLDIAR